MQLEETLNHEQQQQQATAPGGNVADLERKIAALAAAMVVRRNLIAQLQAGNDSDQLAQNALFAELAEAIDGVVLSIDVEHGVTAFRKAALPVSALNRADPDLQEQYSQVNQPQPADSGQQGQPQAWAAGKGQHGEAQHENDKAGHVCILGSVPG